MPRTIRGSGAATAGDQTQQGRRPVRPASPSGKVGRAGIGRRRAGWPPPTRRTTGRWRSRRAITTELRPSATDRGGSGSGRSGGRPGPGRSRRRPTPRQQHGGSRATRGAVWVEAGVDARRRPPHRPSSISAPVEPAFRRRGRRPSDRSRGVSHPGGPAAATARGSPRGPGPGSGGSRWCAPGVPGAEQLCADRTPDPGAARLQLSNQQGASNGHRHDECGAGPRAVPPGTEREQAAWDWPSAFGRTDADPRWSPRPEPVVEARRAPTHPGHRSEPGAAPAPSPAVGPRAGRPGPGPPSAPTAQEDAGRATRHHQRITTATIT